MPLISATLLENQPDPLEMRWSMYGLLRLILTNGIPRQEAGIGIGASTGLTRRTRYVSCWRELED
jgi:hypothetical protein